MDCVEGDLNLVLVSDRLVFSVCSPIAVTQIKRKQSNHMATVHEKTAMEKGGKKQSWAQYST